MANRTITADGNTAIIETVAQNGYITGISMGYDDLFNDTGRSLKSVIGFITINGEPGIALQHDIEKLKTEVLGNPPRFPDEEGGSLKIPIKVGDTIVYQEGNLIYELRPDKDLDAQYLIHNQATDTRSAVAIMIEDVV